MKLIDIFSFFMMISVISLMGFLLENIWMSVAVGYIDNRNMNFPFLIGYGLFVTLLYLLFGTPENPKIFGKEMVFQSENFKGIAYFLIIMLAVSLGEIVLGKTVEKACHFYWWDYSDLPLHVTRYTSIPTSMGFTAIIMFFMQNVYGRMFQSFHNWNIYLIGIVSSVLMIMMIVDYFQGIYLMYMKKSQNIRYRIDTTWLPVYKLFHQKGEDADLPEEKLKF